ncbi:hypothetical protein H0H87_002601 [Tephrocybe sp. NHM501043]|nr:hypothetical protein H0H87_002601 [Tephrocybe sp. NHM501043]
MYTYPLDNPRFPSSMTDDEVPPPYSEQELDQKISHALVISAQEPRATQSHQGTTDDGEWEQWDEAAFAAAEANNRRAQGLDARSSASYLYAQSHEEVGSSPFPVPSAVAPLRIHKRGGKSSSSASGYDGTFGSPGSSSSGHVLWKTQHEIPVDSDDETNDRSIPPPPFASMGPRMDGIFRLEYHPESTPPSPLNSPVSEHRLPLAPDPSFSLHPQTSSNPRRLSPQTQPHSPHKAPRQSLPIPPRSPNYHLEQRSISTFHPHQSMARTQPPVTMPPHNVDRLRQYTVSTLPPSSSQIQPPTHTVSLSALTKVDQTFPTTPQTQSYTLGALYKLVIHTGVRTAY